MIEICLGIALVAFFPHLPPLWLILISIAISLIVLFYFRQQRAVSGLVYGLLAVAYASLWGTWNMAHRLALSSNFIDVQVVGVVQGLPDVSRQSQRFRLGVESISVGDERAAVSPDHTGNVSRLRQLQLNWYQPSEMVEPGQRWRFSVRLKPPQGASNPGGFDYVGWLFQQQVDAMGYVTAHSVPQREGAAEMSIHRLRFELIRWLEATGLSPASVATLRALILGDKRALTADQWQLLQNSGTVHLIVISGLHIGVACLLGYWLGGVLLLMVSRCCPRVADLRGCRAVPALLLATGYAALAGFSIPTQRALIMAAMLLIPPLFNYMPSLWQRWWLALTAVLVLQPLSVNQAGLWLSFAAVAALLLVCQQGDDRSYKSIAYRALHSQRAVFVVLLPLLVFFTGGVSVWAPLINLVAIPYVSFVLLPLALVLLLLLPLSPVSIALALDGLVDIFWHGLAAVAGNTDALLTVTARPLWVVAAALCGALLLTLPRLMFFRVLGCFLLLPLIKPLSSRPNEGVFTAWVFDVGQGTSVLLQTRQHALLYDTGAGFRNGGSVAQYSVIPALRAMGVQRIDRVVVSHADNDHAGGYPAIQAAFAVQRTESGSAPWRRRFRAQACRNGQRWTWDGVQFEYIQPARVAVDSENNRSCVLLVRSANCALLLPGDIESAVERQIVAAHPELSVDWLVAAHHGSRSSTDRYWLQHLAPQEVLFSAGKGNRYGHPAAAVVARVEAQGSVWRSTAEAGAIQLTAGVDGCTSSAYREQKRRYWSDG